MTDPVCCDISHWQSSVDFAKVKASGVRGVIAKATESTTYRDDTYARNRQGAKDNGLLFASYHFARPGDPSAQARFYLDFAKPDQGSRVVYDWEDAGVSMANALDFLKAVRNARPDLQLTVYCSSMFGPAQPRNDWLVSNTSLWVARYTSSASVGTLPGSWSAYSLWQYSQEGKVPGVSSNCDINRFNGPDDQFDKWMGPVSGAVTPPAPGPAPDVEIPILTLSSDAPVSIRLGANVTIVK
jgi:lysozyme